MAAQERATEIRGAGYTFLVDLPLAAYKAGDLDKAERYAEQLLEAAAAEPESWNTGNAFHVANTALGLVALERGDLGSAKARLLDAARTKGSPQLNSFGPDWTLAKKLLERGERETVLECIELCRKFWAGGSERLDEWSEWIHRGEMPFL